MILKNKKFNTLDEAKNYAKENTVKAPIITESPEGISLSYAELSGSESDLYINSRSTIYKIVSEWHFKKR